MGCVGNSSVVWPGSVQPIATTDRLSPWLPARCSARSSSAGMPRRTLLRASTPVIIAGWGTTTLVTGGKLTNEKRNNAENLGGTGIEGGQTREVAKGDFFFVPANTPGFITDRLQREIADALDKPDIKQRLLGAGAEAVSSSPEAFAARIRSYVAINGKMIKDLGIRTQ